METIYFSSCPVCSSIDIHPSLTVKDHAVSGEAFEINECGACSARFTQNIPGPAAISKYYRSAAYISHTDTREGFINKLYHVVRRITLAQKNRQVEKAVNLKKGKLLDVGAGTGLFVQSMQRAGWQATGLEPDETARQKANSRDAEYYAADWAAYDVPRHLFHFSPASMKGLLKKHGFRLQQLHPQWFDSFYVSLLSEQYRTGKTRLFSGGWQGLLSDIRTIRDKDRCSSLVYVASLV